MDLKIFSPVTSIIHFAETASRQENPSRSNAPRKSYATGALDNSVAPDVSADSGGLGHTFAVSPLERGAGSKPSKYFCHCIRCKWTFRVNLDTGSIIALDETGEPISDPEASHRIDTFAEGPCPALVRFPEYLEIQDRAEHQGILAKLHPLLHLFGIARAA